MNRLLPLVVAFLCAPLFAQVTSKVAPAAALKVTARAERANATYQVGEKVTFAVSVAEKGKPANLRLRVQNYGTEALTARTPATRLAPAR
jgi:hypothetical protein